MDDFDIKVTRTMMAHVEGRKPRVLAEATKVVRVQASNADEALQKWIDQGAKLPALTLKAV